MRTNFYEKVIRINKDNLISDLEIRLGETFKDFFNINIIFNDNQEVIFIDLTPYPKYAEQLSDTQTFYVFYDTIMNQIYNYYLNLDFVNNIDLNLMYVNDGDSDSVNILNLSKGAILFDEFDYFTIKLNLNTPVINNTP